MSREGDHTDTDRYWLERDYVAVVPVGVDYTHHKHLPTFKYLENT
jgi:hypothetical protein